MGRVYTREELVKAVELFDKSDLKDKLGICFSCGEVENRSFCHCDNDD